MALDTIKEVTEEVTQEATQEVAKKKRVRQEIENPFNVLFTTTQDQRVNTGDIKKNYDIALKLVNEDLTQDFKVKLSNCYKEIIRNKCFHGCNDNEVKEILQIAQERSNTLIDNLPSLSEFKNYKQRVLLEVIARSEKEYSYTDSYKNNVKNYQLYTNDYLLSDFKIAPSDNLVLDIDF